MVGAQWATVAAVAASQGARSARRHEQALLAGPARLCAYKCVRTTRSEAAASVCCKASAGRWADCWRAAALGSAVDQRAASVALGGFCS